MPGFGLFVAVMFLAGVAIWITERQKVARRLQSRASDGPRLSYQDVRTEMERLAQTTLLMTPTEARVFSMLGGSPELPEGLQWPDGSEAPRTFLAQIDLAECGSDAPAWLPQSGRLYAFWDDQENGAADYVTLIYTHEVAAGARQPPPSAKRFPERRVGFTPRTSKPSLDWLDVDLPSLDVTPRELDELADAPEAAFGSDVQHRLCGYPSEIQSSQMQIECEYVQRKLRRNWKAPVPTEIAQTAADWRLLLQIDSDPDLRMNWSDNGRLYVFVREADARAGDFGRTVTLSQSY